MTIPMSTLHVQNANKIRPSETTTEKKHSALIVD